MMWKQHTGFKSRLLALLFLFFNCICTAAPSLKFTDNYKEVVSRVVSTPGGEEETHTVQGYINSSVSPFSDRKHADKKACHSGYHWCSNSFSTVASSDTSIPDASVVPLPGNYAFLFRYNLF